MADIAVHAEALVKTYGDVRALDGLNLDVEKGTVLGLLGPNGAGKTTAVRILTTLLKPDSGIATVAGIDVRRDPDKIKSMIGLTGQYAAVDEYLTGRENITMIGGLYHLEPKWIKRRGDELLERFRLTDAADRPAKTYSGGMRRRLDLAASLVAKPEIIFLDEPTTGLDPRSRLELWDIIEGMVKDGRTVLLTTQYLEEADYLAEKIVVIDQGKVIAEGTSETLKDSVGGDKVEIVVTDTAQLAAASASLAAVGNAEPVVSEIDRKVSVAVGGGSTVLVDVVRSLDSAGVVIEDLALRRPTLDDVFLSLTGHTAEEDTAQKVQDAKSKKRRGKKEAE